MHARVEAIHKKALEVVARYRSCEADLIEILQQADSARVHYALGYNSLYHYCTSALGLSEDIAYAFILLARKSNEVPALKQEIREGKITVSKARRIVPVLNKGNQDRWLELAKTVSKKDLERAVVTEKPELAVPEKVKFVQAERLQIQFGASRTLARKIERVREIESQKKGKVETIESAVEVMADIYLHKEDPLQKARRFAERRTFKELGKNSQDLGQRNDANLNLLGPGQVNVHGAAKSDSSNRALSQSPITRATSNSAQIRPQNLAQDTRRTFISSAIRHQLHLQFNGQCGHIDQAGKRCQERRFLHIHHKKAVSEGGDNSLANLELLCSGHHKTRHH